MNFAWNVRASVKMLLTRNVTRAECHWLPRDLKEGETVFRYHGHTYGCISPTGTAISLEENGPFLEVPSNSVRMVSQ